MAEKPTRLEKRANGYWYILYPGNSRGKSTGTRDVGEAQAAYDRWRANEKAAQGVQPGLTVHQAIDDYLVEHVRPKVVSKPQAEIMAAYFMAHFSPSHRVADVRDEDIDCPKDLRRPGSGNGYIQKRREGRIVLKNPNPVPASDGSLRREIGFLSSAFEHAGRKKGEDGKARIAKAEIPFLPRPSQPAPRDRYLTQAEEAQLVAACQVEWPATKDKPARLTRIYRFLMLAIHTGARKEALEKLTWLQVDFRTGSIDLNPVGRKQTAKRRPVVRMSRALRAVLERAWEERTGGWVLDGNGDIRTAFETLVERSGLQDVSPHVLRHTWATRAAQNGVPMREIADWLGDNIATVEKNYYKRSPHYLKDAVDWREREVGDARQKG